MDNKKCFDVVSKEVKNQSDNFSPFWKINEEKYESLRICCNQIDGFSNKIDTYKEDKDVCYSVNIDEKEKTIAVFMSICDGEISFLNNENIYYFITEKALSTGFSTTGNNILVITFVFPSVWERVK